MINEKAERRLTSILRQYVLSKPVQQMTSVASTAFANSGNQASSKEKQQQQESLHGNKPTTQQEPLPMHAELTQHEKTTDQILHYEEEFREMFNRLESGKLSPGEALGTVNQMLNEENADFNRVRYFAFQLLPYLQEEGEESEEDSSIRRAYRLIGLSYYKNSEFEKALAWFRKAARKSQSINDWFNLSTTAAQANQIELAIHAFEQLEILHKVAKYELRPSFWSQLYWFTVALLNGGKYNNALEQLNRLKLAYKRARFTDREYLQEIGLPAFEDFLSLSITLFERVNRSGQAIQFLKQMQEGVDNTGKEIIQKMLDKLQQ